MNSVGYRESVHRHRFAAWCASTAANSSPNCRFSVQQGVRLIEDCGLQTLSEDWGKLPQAQEFDAHHRMWRERLIAVAPTVLPEGERRQFTAGVAAKLINCYLKPLFVTGLIKGLSRDEAAARDAIHPPIDRILLKTLSAADVGSWRREWKRFADIGWSNFSHEQYEAVVEMVKTVTLGRLWTVEEHWGGYQTSRGA